MSLKILVIDDDASVTSMLIRFLGSEGHEATGINDPSRIAPALSGGGWDLIFCDMYLGTTTGVEVLKQAKQALPATPFVIMTAHGAMDVAMDAIRGGAFDFIGKPVAFEQLRQIVRRAAESQRQFAQVTVDSLDATGAMLGRSPAMVDVYKWIARVAPLDTPVLIHGESGTGKELIARALHNLSSRQKLPFIAINCSALPEPLLESEIFGHKRGSFTGAFADKKGLFEEAEGGSTFLDEIGSMPMTLQSKLLRFLQEKELRRVGDNTTRKVNVRVIAATNEKLEEKIRLGSFREDLFYRLSVIPLEIPPLRERLTDVPLLVQHFVKISADAMGIEMPKLEPEALRLMQSYSWPGNVRELQNAIERAVAMSNREWIKVEDLPERIRMQETPAHSHPLAIRPLKDVLREFERDYCSKALKLAHGDRRAAAHMLKISLPSFYRKLPPSMEDLPQ